MSSDRFKELSGFDLDSYVRSAKRDFPGLGKVRVMFDNPNAQAMSTFNNGVLEVHLPTKAIIRAQRPELSDEAITAKIKAATCEELAHGVFHETNHDEKVVGATIACMIHNMTKPELEEPYIVEKMNRLQMAALPVASEAI